MIDSLLLDEAALRQVLSTLSRLGMHLLPLSIERDPGPSDALV